MTITIRVRGTKVMYVGTNLHGVDLPGANLTGANLYGADLTGVDLECTQGLRGTFVREPIRAYYYSPKNEVIPRGRVKIRPGLQQVRPLGSTLGLCVEGYHASLKRADAESYRPGGVCWLVELSGRVVIGKNKVVASRRRFICRA